MSNFKKYQSIALAFIFMCASASGLYFMWVSVDGFGADLYESVQAVTNERAFDTQYSELQSILEETEVERQVLDTFVLQDDSDTIALLSKIDEIAFAQGVVLTTNNLKVVESTTDFNDLAVSFSIEGDETGVFNMVRMFETLPYHGRITNLDVNRSSEKTTNRVTSKVTISLLLSIKKYD